MGGQASLSVRLADVDDIDFMLVLQREAFGDDPVCLTRAQIAACCTSRQVDALIAEADGNRAGYAILRKRPFRPWASLDFVAVSKRLRRTGIGSALVAAAVPMVRRRSLRLLVRADNHPAVAFYRRQGFEAAGLRAGHYADGCDALVMIRRL